MKETSDTTKFGLPAGSSLAVGSCVFVAAVLGALQAWVRRYAMNPDGVSYLDIADAYREGTWSAALNSYWSPAYSWLLAGLFSIFHPSPEDEFPLVHVLNFVLYLVALAAFTFLVLRLLRDSNPLSIVFAYLLFLFGSLHWIPLSFVTPDMLVAATVYFVSALMISPEGQIDARRAALIGGALGIGYLSKAAMFPLAFACLALLVVGRGDRLPALRNAGVALAVFGIVSLPWLTALSLSQGRLTFGDAGKLSYLWIVNGVGWWPHRGSSAHGPSQIFENPEVLEFAAPFRATYSPWYDPAYWHEGKRVHFDLNEQLRATSYVLRYYAVNLFRPLIGVFVGLGVLCVAARHQIRGAIPWRPVLWSVAALLLFAGVYVEKRHVAGFVVAGLVLMYAGSYRAAHRNRPWIAKGTTFAMIVLLASALLPGAAGTLSRWRTGKPVGSDDLRMKIYRDLTNLGIRPGDSIASVGRGFRFEYVRLTRARITAEIPDDDVSTFWRMRADERRVLFDRLSASGVRAIVARRIPEKASARAKAEGWQRLGESRQGVLLLGEGMH